nr:hypothetical protein [Muribaculaceae bacterium]
MRTIEQLQQIFDKYACHCAIGCGGAPFIETSRSADLKKVHITISSGDLGVLKNPFYKGMTHITTDRSSHLRDSDSDGVIFYNNGADKRIIFLELKSSLSGNNIKKATSQHLFTFLKLHTMMSLCKDYALSDYSIEFHIACRICDEAGLASIKSNLVAQEEANDMDYKNYMLKSLLYGRNDWSCAIKDLPVMKPLLGAMQDEILDKSVLFKIMTTPDPNDKELTYSL